MKIDAILSVIALMLFAQGCFSLSDEMTASYVEVPSYDAISVSDGIGVIISANVEKAEVTAGRSTIGNVLVEVKDRTLNVAIYGVIEGTASSITVVVPYSSSLDEVSLSGASTLVCDSIVVGAHLLLSADGSSVAALGGSVGTLELNLTDKSRFLVAEGRGRLSCDFCKGSVGGSSQAYIHSDGDISLSITGGSTVRYTGDASVGGCTLSADSRIVHDEEAQQ